MPKYHLIRHIYHKIKKEEKKKEQKNNALSNRSGLKISFNHHI